MHLVRLDRCRAVVMGTRPAETFRMVRRRSAALMTPSDVWRPRTDGMILKPKTDDSHMHCSLVPKLGGQNPTGGPEGPQVSSRNI